MERRGKKKKPPRVEKWLLLTADFLPWPRRQSCVLNSPLAAKLYANEKLFPCLPIWGSQVEKKEKKRKKTPLPSTEKPQDQLILVDCSQARALVRAHPVLPLRLSPPCQEPLWWKKLGVTKNSQHLWDNFSNLWSLGMPFSLGWFALMRKWEKQTWVLIMPEDLFWGQTKLVFDLARTVRPLHGCRLGEQLPGCSVQAKLLQSCPTPCDPTDCSPPGPSVHGILQARGLLGTPI